MSNKVGPADLKAGDVLLYRGTGFISDMIRLFDGSQYSHAALFDGAQIVEAIGSGVAARPLVVSVAGAKYVDVYRFLAKGGGALGDPGHPAAPVLDAAAGYVARADRYAYEQIVLLSLLAATRRMPVITDVPFLRWLLRNILDNAAEVLSRIVSGGKEPLICSELVYRCFKEAGPRYDIEIRGADILAMRARATLSSSEGGLRTGTAPLEDPVVSAELDAFLAKYQVAKSRGAALAAGSSAKPKKAGRALAASAAPAGSEMALAVANFVTPRDLRDSPNLMRVGTLQM